MVEMGTLTPMLRRSLIMSAKTRCSRSLRNSLEGPCSQARQVLSAGRSWRAAKALASSMYSRLWRGTPLSGNSALPKCWVMSFSLVSKMAAIAGSSL
ncbi:hypothetical protein D3C72_2268980 [compost metagenome]